MWCIILRNFKQFLISREIDYLSKLFLVASKCQVVFWNSVDVASSEESCEYAWLQWTLGHRDSWVVECGEWMWCPPLSLAPHFFVPLSVKALAPSSPPPLAVSRLCISASIWTLSPCHTIVRSCYLGDPSHLSLGHGYTTRTVARWNTDWNKLAKTLLPG